MTDLKVVAAHRDGVLVFALDSDGIIQRIDLTEPTDWPSRHLLDPDGHVWAAITGSQERPASTVSPDSPELEALREIRDLLRHRRHDVDPDSTFAATLDAIDARLFRILGPNP